MGDRRLEAVLYWTLGSSNLCCLPRISLGLGDELEAQMMSISDLLGSKPALVNQLGHNLRLAGLLLKILDSEILDIEKASQKWHRCAGTMACAYDVFKGS